MGPSVWEIVSLGLIISAFGSAGNRMCVHHVQPPYRSEVKLDLEEYILQEEAIQKDNKTIRCKDSDKYCFSYWGLEVLDNGSLSSFLLQGCWNGPDSPLTCLDEHKCVASWGQQVQGNYLNQSLWCCCESNLCNANMSDGNGTQLAAMTIEDEEPEVQPEYAPDSKSYKQLTIITSLFSVTAVAIIISSAYLIYRKCFMTAEPKIPPLPDTSSMYLVKSPSTPSFQLDELKFCSLVTRGRFGEVWRGTLGESDVAIKMFTANQRSYFVNERAIYLLPHMNHEALLHFYGSEERVAADGSPQYIIVVNYVPQGNLTSYLKNNLMDWITMCRMVNSITRGLAYLHSEIEDHDNSKPAVAHRDLNSRNILVNSDLSCSICDFGFAMKIKRVNFLLDGPEESLEQTALTDVGTLRYMAPEVLEGAVNLRDCESSLKQIDVYALGLVIWELATRCSDLYQGTPVPEYTLPFQAELGLHPSFEEMQLLVTKTKARPKFPNVWKDSNSAIRALKETIEDCWDQDGEARLTALCAEERLVEMTGLWDHRHKGVTPTMLTSALGTLEEKTEVQHNLTHPEPSHGSLATTHASLGMTHTALGTVNLGVEVSQMSEPVNELSQNMSRRAQRASCTDNSTSTMETTVSPSDFEDPLSPVNKHNCNLVYARQSRALQPHQGQNPTVERNTHKRSAEDVTVLGNTLVSKSAAASLSSPSVTAGSSSSASAANRRRIPNTTATLTEELMGAISDNWESSLVQNDLLNQNQPQQHHTVTMPMVSHPPIPYLQNQVHQSSASEPLVVRPKQPNVPGNGCSQLSGATSGLHSAPSNLSNQLGPPNISAGPSNLNRNQDLPVVGVQPKVANTSQKQGWFSKLLKSKGDKKELNTDNKCQKPLLASQPLNDRDRKSGSNLNFPFFNKSSVASSTSSLYSSPSPASTASRGSVGSSVGGATENQVPTVVKLLNGTPVVRPTSLPVTGPSSRKPNRNSWASDEQSNVVQAVPNGNAHDVPTARKVSNVKPQNCDDQLHSVEIGIARLENGSCRSERKGSGHSRVRSSSDLTPGGSERDSNGGRGIQLSDLGGGKRGGRGALGSAGSTASDNSSHGNNDDPFDNSSASTAFSDPVAL